MKIFKKILFVFIVSIVLLFIVGFIYLHRSHNIPDYDTSKLELVNYVENLPKEENGLYVINEYFLELGEGDLFSLDNNSEDGFTPGKIFSFYENSYFGYDFGDYNPDYEYYENLFENEEIPNIIKDGIKKYENIFDYYYNDDEFKKIVYEVNDILNDYEHFQLDKSVNINTDIIYLKDNVKKLNKNILGVAIYSCHIGDYGTCLKYIDIAYNLSKTIFDSPNLYINILISVMNIKNNIYTIEILLNTYDIPEEYLIELKSIVKENRINKESLLNSFRMEFNMFKNTVDDAIEKVISEEEIVSINYIDIDIDDISHFDVEETKNVYGYMISKYIDGEFNEAYDFIESYTSPYNLKNRIGKALFDTLGVPIVHLKNLDKLIEKEDNTLKIINDLIK
ncbi:hypothetical protein [Candidatus Vampirococcus lugosii]|uniref:Uncharacterized protein n=1 Tax=Candidatus Vampirococcus lugosii TaxID=2789015 RepID=A0ABS5QKI8_9BACT|nr:hypothetical protein [Candidatus Vampirococcus lugosii]MBS8121717.1 hypothetical protein [Candidatus Vampirococcus lugosii]